MAHDLRQNDCVLKLIALPSGLNIHMPIVPIGDFRALHTLTSARSNTTNLPIHSFH